MRPGLLQLPLGHLTTFKTCNRFHDSILSIIARSLSSRQALDSTLAFSYIPTHYSLGEQGAIKTVLTCSLSAPSQRKIASLPLTVTLAQRRSTPTVTAYATDQLPAVLAELGWDNTAQLLAKQLAKYGATTDSYHAHLQAIIPPLRAGRSFIANAVVVTDPRFPALSAVYITMTQAVPARSRALFDSYYLRTLACMHSADLLTSALTYIAAFSSLTAFVRHHGNAAFHTHGRQWTAFSDWETCVCRVVSTDQSVLESQISDWLTGPPVPRPLWFYQEYRRSAAALSSAIWDARSPSHMADIQPLTPSDFVARPELWGTTGSAYGFKHLAPDGTRRTFPNKWALYSGLSHSQLCALVRLPSSVPLKAVAKPELTKLRAVVAAPASQYLKMAYLSYFIEAVLAGQDFSPLFMSARAIADRKRRILKSLGTSYHMPVDQSHFDYQPDFYMIYLWLTHLILIAARAAPECIRQSVIDVGINLLVELSPSNLRVLRASGSIEGVNHGLPSGWRWTALLDTLINFTEYKALVYSVRADALFSSPWFQGDDIQTTSSSLAAAHDLVAAYADANLEVNLKKFWISRSRDEFLRQVYDDAKVSGYPARALYKLFYMDAAPVEKCSYLQHVSSTHVHTRAELERMGFADFSPAPPGIATHDRARTYELVSNWSVYLSRLRALLPDDKFQYYLDWFFRDVANATKIKKEKIYQLLTTPAHFGGYNLIPPVTVSTFRPVFVVPVVAQAWSTRVSDGAAPFTRELKNYDVLGNIRRSYGSSAAAAKLWLPRLSGKPVQVAHPAIRGVTLCTAVLRSYPKPDVSSSNVSDYFRVGKLQKVANIVYSEAERFRNPDLVEDYIRSRTNLSNTRIRRLVAAVNNPLRLPESMMYDDFLPESVLGYALTLNAALTTVAGTAAAFLRGAFSLRLWFISLSSTWNKDIYK